LDGLLIALANLDEVIRTIRQAKDVETAKLNLIERFKLSEIQAQAILDMQLRRLAALERQKIEDEHQEIMARIAYLEDLLANPQKILGVIQDDLRELSEKFGDDRRTRITAEAHEDLKIEDLVADEAVLVTITQRGYIKRTNASLYRTQNRGGRGVSGQSVREEDEVITLLPARTLDTILFFSDLGKVYSEKTYNLPDAGRTDKGIPIVNVLALEPNERITAALSVHDFDAANYCTMATAKGRMKRVSLSEFANVRPSGLIAISLDSGDQLGWARLTSGKDDIILVTSGGQALRIAEKDIRAMGRTAGGVAGIKLKNKDLVTSMEVVEPGGFLLVVTRQGFGKRVALSDYPKKSRATGGIITQDLKNMDRTGPVVSARVVQEADDVTFISSNGIVLRLKVKEISLTGRATRGVHLMDLGKGDGVASLARFPAVEVGKNGDEKPDNGNSAG
jgi:DNA gyrase subunit A